MTRELSSTSRSCTRGWQRTAAAAVPQANQRVASNFAALSQNPDHLEVALEAQKEQGRYGAATTTEESQELWGGYSAPRRDHPPPYFGLTVVSCERGAIRQSPDGLVVYGQNGLQEIPVARTMRGAGPQSWLNYIGRSLRTALFSTTVAGGARDARSMFRHPAVGLRRSRSRSLPTGIAVTSDEEKSWVRL